ncbi:MULTISPECIES: hypothetical protein [unclassified Leptolyngbya]|uniref:hypothetical protein n=1 Tax=unclassified Leptolyngbya TaxID=2650499 RepID=UPI001684AD39|nr:MULTISPECIES: hypothetical protein [unclassified Leptolyngbya]MBD2154226.1 hypothetical protein [Leptolyngbya sp. FACHB-16]
MTRIRKQNENPNNEESNLEDSLVVQPADEAIASGVDRLMEVIEQTVENLGDDDAERQMLRQGVTTIVQETLLDFLRPQDGSMEAASMGLIAPLNENTKLGTDGNQTSKNAVDLAVRGSQEVGMAFVNFTQGLISGTFNSIIKATIDQMKAYSDMVAEITKSLKEFASDNVSDDAVNEKLEQLTLVEGDEKFELKKGEPRRAYHLKRLFYLAPVTGGYRAAILYAFGVIDSKTAEFKEDEVKAIFEKEDFDSVGGIEVRGSKIYTDDDMADIVAAIKHGLARDGMNQLRQMAREGMARIVITEGQIDTKLIFQVSSQETNTSRTSNTDRNSYGGNLKAGAFWGWGSASMSAHYNQLKVSTVDQTSVGNIETLTRMSGQVTLKFKTDYKPLNDSSGSVKESDLAPIL